MSQSLTAVPLTAPLIAPPIPPTVSPAVIVPEPAALRELSDAAITELPNYKLLRTKFYSQVGDAVFKAAHSALTDTVNGESRMHTVPAPVGAGKTSFAVALIAAMTRYANTHPTAPYGSVFVVDQIRKADEVYTQLSALLPGNVAIWTTEHDPASTQWGKLGEPPTETYTREALCGYPVAVVTHKFYLGTNGHNACTIVRNGLKGNRALTVVDERPDEAPTLEITLSQAQAVREQLVELHPDIKGHLDILFQFMEERQYDQPNKLIRPGKELPWERVSTHFRWFKSNDAEQIAKDAAQNIPGIAAFFDFARALANGRACVATHGRASPSYFGYETQRIIDRSAGCVLLDATADIDGVKSIAPWRVETETPHATYERLDIVHVPQHTKKNLSKYLKTAANQRAYVEWVVETIMQNMEPGQKGLVICKKVLLDHQRLPNWPDGDQRFDAPKTYTEDYGWDLEGRKLCVTHWGTGIGSNTWNGAEVVFLFDEFFRPRRVDIATTQGLSNHRADEGDLGSMTTLNSKAKGVDHIAEGHRLRWTKQLALRGNARHYDENGVCGKQRLVIGSDLKGFMLNAPKLFPGATIRVVDDMSTAALEPRIIEVLNKTHGPTLTTKELSKRIGKPWRTVSSNIVSPEFKGRIRELGWDYKGRGRGGARFERLTSKASEAEQSCASLNQEIPLAVM